MLYFLYDSYEVTGMQYNLCETEPSLNGDPGFIGYVFSPENIGRQPMSNCVLNGNCLIWKQKWDCWESIKGKLEKWGRKLIATW